MKKVLNGKNDNGTGRGSIEKCIGGNDSEKNQEVEGMKVLVLLGSRNPEGQTATAARAMLDGVREAGGDGELVFLPDLNLERCRQCGNTGYGTCKSDGKCVIEDDFAAVVEKLKKADAAVFATPVYFYDLSESMRSFLDRLRRLTRNENGKKGIAGKKVVSVCVAGGGGGGAPTCSAIFERIFTYLEFDLVDTIPVRRQNLVMKKSALKETGRLLAAGTL
jgi:multimeric flavodoxin WrbA